MPMRHAQRKHIIHSLNSLLYQLHTVSFLLSPSVYSFICRLVLQWHISRPREADPNRSLRFWFIIIILVNLWTIWSHASEGAAQGRSIVLDFIGIADAPSKIYLLSLDFLSVTLNMLLATIAFETSLSLALPSDTPDPLLPIPDHRPTAHLSTREALAEEAGKDLGMSYGPQRELIIDVRLSTLLSRLRHPPPPPPPPQGNLNEILPMPNTTPFQLSSSLRMLLRARAQMRERATQRPAQEDDPTGAGAESDREGRGSRRVPGGMTGL